MRLSPIRKFLLLVSIVVVIASGLFLFKVDEIFNVDKKQSAMEQVEQKQLEVMTEKLEGNGVASDMPEEGVPRSAADVAVVQSWFKQVGFSLDGEKAYENAYSDDQLIAMANAGDVIAFDALSKRYLYRGETDKAFEYAERSIVYGSLNGISMMSSRDTPILHEDDSFEVRKEAKDMFKQKLAYLELMRLRGAGKLYAVHVDTKVVMDNFKVIYGEENPLSGTDYEEISANAKRLYDGYQEERHRLGLGDFDNELPEEVEAFLSGR